MIFETLPKLVLVFFSIELIRNSDQQIYKSHISLKNEGTQFIPSSAQDYPLSTTYVPSVLRCAQHCDRTSLCRIFVYDKITLMCLSYRSDLSSGSILLITNSTARVGQISYDNQLSDNYNQSCDKCQANRYLICLNGRCQCPSTTYWDGVRCQNQLYHGQSCNSSLSSCRTDLNLACIVGSCQVNTAFCRMNTTGITFDDVPNRTSTNNYLPSTYKGLQWINGRYLNATAYPSSGYPILVASDEYVAWFNSPLTVQNAVVNQTFQFNTLLMAAGWSDLVTVAIVGYYSNIQRYNTSVSLSRYARQAVSLEWSGINKIIFTPSSTGYVDTGLENLCLTWKN